MIIRKYISKNEHPLGPFLIEVEAVTSTQGLDVLAYELEKIREDAARRSRA